MVFQAWGWESAPRMMYVHQFVMELRRFRDLPLLGILRGVRRRDIEPVTEAVVAAGLTAIEVTMNTFDAADLIRGVRESAGPALMVGAGTVLDTAALETALEAGATFIVLPVVVPEVVARCVERGIPVFPGALTPREILDAWRTGATMVKVFPASVVGPAYFREVKGPLPDIELLACGGVTAENMRAYVSAGASAVAFGGSVFRPEWLAAGQYGQVGAQVRRLVEAYQEAAAEERERRRQQLG